ncbi:hypothetical protein H7H78_14380 [Mycobacterium shinjukuense]|uniref:Uncharacterized protein n=1 Tax=Mycobacterium shinjukuense TaxID=398694 RepID=A0A7I7MUA9_9MYCO|nr:hypothetical protein [Mycobacterium shinjukuense]MCV6986568.1 hypothetical protein [Mycobacterium shinjukuense]ORB67293.1 hypothetical protein BST45_12840 [Mycobacterium shinjukuense]BBX75530.1 hypothetical protein MSHI_34360 [Mycobacterium shinjukuense]
MSTGCRDCRAGVEHCHGTLIRHADGPLQGRAECTEVDCLSPQLVPHAFVVDCDAIGCGCAGSIALAV